MTNKPAGRTVSYWAISVLNSKTMWFNLLSAIVPALELTELKVLIPPRWMPYYALAVVLGNMWLRKATVRPVAFIAPGDTQEIEVKRLSPPAPSKVAVTD